MSESRDEQQNKVRQEPKVPSHTVEHKEDTKLASQPMELKPDKNVIAPTFYSLMASERGAGDLIDKALNGKIAKEETQ
jgi:hypothetical protein